MTERSLTRFAWLSVAAAIATIAHKTGAWWVTGSVGLLSDAVESLVNLVAALMALWMLTLAERPPDEEHAFGYSKAEYFSSGLEGAMIFVAAAVIVATAVPRVLRPEPLEAVGLGLTISVVASAINFAVAWALFRAAKRYGSITLEADAHHLMTDVWTSAGVLVGVLLVKVTGWNRLDPLVAIGVAINILWTGYGLLRRSAAGLMDPSVPQAQRTAIRDILARHEKEGIEFHAVRTRQAAGRAFVSMHVLVPGAWTVKKGHDLADAIEHEIREALPRTTVTTHLEPLEDPASHTDTGLNG